MAYEFMDTEPRNEVMAREGYYRDWTHVNADVFYQIMELVTFIREKGHGVDVREVIAQGFERIYHDASIEGNANMEMSASRGSFETLVLRLASMDSKISSSMSQTEFDSWVATLLDGGPSIFMDSLAMLQSTYPTGASGVALVRETDPAKIYVWDGGVWKDFGEYQGVELKDGAVTTTKYAYDSVTAQKLNFIKKPKNGFDKSRINTGFYLNNSGGLSPSVNNTVTDYFMPVVPGATFSISPLPNTTANNATIVVFYQSENESSFVSRRSFTTADTNPSDTIPSTANFARVSIDNKIINNFQFEMNGTPTAYEGYRLPLLNRDKVELVLKYGEVTPDDTSFLDHSINHFNKKTADLGFYISSTTGNRGESPRNFVSEPIRSKSNVTWTLSPRPLPLSELGQPFVVVFKDEDGAYLDGLSIADVGVQTFTTPYKTHWIEFSGDVRFIDVIQLEKGPMATAFERYYVNLKNQDVVSVDTSPILWLGDSIGANSSVTTKLSDLIKAEVKNGAFGSTTISYHKDANLNALSFNSIAHAIASGDFTPQETAVANLGVAYHTVNLSTLKTTDFSKVKRIILQSSTNDFGGNRTPLVEMKQGLRDGIQTILGTYPHVQFYVVTPLYRQDKTGPNEIGVTLSQYGDAVAEVVEEFSFPVLNGLKGMGINASNIGYFLKTDLLHPNPENGDEQVANKISNFILSN